MTWYIRRLSIASVLLLLVLAVFALAIRSSCGASVEEDFSSRINEAKDALQRAFAAVLDAENAGANVSSLLAELNMAGKNLTEAEMAYKSGDLVEAENKSEQCSLIADRVVEQASALKSSASLDARRSEWQTFSFSGIGAFVFVVALVSIWILFKRSYNRKLLDLKPEGRSSAEA